MHGEPVVVIGGGFAGLEVALQLDRMSGGRLDMPIFLIDPSPDHIYTPSFQEVFNPVPSVMAVPFATILERTHIQFLQDRVIHIDYDSKQVVTERRKIKFGDCVIATGSVVQKMTGGDHSAGILACQKIEDVVELRRHIDSCARQTESPKANTCLSHILIIGGGVTGVEFAATIAQFLERKITPTAKKQSIHLTVVESASRLVPQLPEPVSRSIYDYLRKRGVTIALGHDMTWRAAKTLVSHQGDSLKRSVIWTSGAQAQELGRSTKGLKCDRYGRVLVDAGLQVVDFPGIWAAGDMASMVDTGSTEAAIAQGRHVARAIIAKRARKIVPAYQPRHFVQVIQLSQHYGFLIRKNDYLDGPITIWYKQVKMLRYLRKILPLRKALQLWTEGGKRLNPEEQVCAPTGALLSSTKSER